MFSQSEQIPYNDTENTITIIESTPETSTIKVEDMLTEDDSNVAEVVLSNKGGPKVIHKGFMYTLHKKQPNNIRWRCVGRTLHCRGSLITTADCKKPRTRMQHNHSPDFAAAQLARKRYIALGQPPVLPDDGLRPRINPQSGNIEERNDFFTWSDWQHQNPRQLLPILPKDEESKRITRSSSRNSGLTTLPDWTNTSENEPQFLPKIKNVIATATRSGSENKTVRIGQSLIRPRNIAPAPSHQSQQPKLPQQQHQRQQQQQHHHHRQLQHQHKQQQQQQQSPKTLVLKTIPLKVKHVAPTTIKMTPRQTPVATPQAALPLQPTEVCLRWNSYHSNMQNSFPSLLDSEQFVDVTLACEGRSLKCHKMILSSCSDYLADLLRENPCQHPIILMKDLKFWEVEALVKFMYRGEVNVAHDKLPQLLNAAEALQIKGLAGPTPSSQSTKPPMLIPQLKPSTSQPIISRISAGTKEAKSQQPSTAAASAVVPQKRNQKRRASEITNENNKPLNKIRLQRPASPTSPVVTVKLEPLDIPLSPTEIYPEENESRSSSARYGNLGDFRGEDDPEGDADRSSADRELNFCEIPGPPDLNDNEEQMEFVPTDFLEQEQEISDDHENEHDNDDLEHDGDEGEDDDDAEDGEDEEDGDDSIDINDIKDFNDKDQDPGRLSRNRDDEIDDEEYPYKLSPENNMT